MTAEAEHAELAGRPDAARSVPVDRVAIGVCLGVVVAFAVALWSHRWTSDDGFINFRIVENVLGGHGPVFNVGERIEAGTSQLWLLVLIIAEGLLGWLVPMEWLAVLLGIGCSVAAVTLALWGQRRSWSRPVLPFALFGWVPLAAVWDFSTSGLEMPLLWLWQAGCFAALAVRAGGDRREPWDPWWLPVLIGLGPLIRPDAAVYSLCFAIGLLILSSRDWKGLLRCAALAVAVPVAYQVFRMAFFAVLVPNTAIAKEAGDAVWARGGRYLWDTVGLYRLWLPIVVLVAAAVWIVLRDRPSSRLLWIWALTALGGVIHGVWVVRLGGDFMHARLLLPDWFMLVLPLSALPLSRLKAPVLAVLAAVLGIWCVWTWVDVRPPLESTRAPGVFDERSVYLAGARATHPVTLDDHRANDYVRWGVDARARAAAGEDVTLWPMWGQLTEAVQSSGGTQLVWPNIGIMGFAAGPDVYIVDSYGLADPIASRLDNDDAGRAGHSKFMGREWIEARFVGGAAPLSEPAAIAREVLQCPPLQRLFDSTTSPLTPKLLVHNVVRSVELTRMRVPDDPERARAALC